MKAALVLLAILGAAILGIAALTEGMELVYLTTYDEGAAFKTRLWVRDDGMTLWIRAGGTERRWYARLLAEPYVELERNGETRSYTAEPDRDPRIVARVNYLMREKYGWVDRISCWVQDPSEFAPIRLHAR